MDQFEKEADSYAQEKLIPKEVWDDLSGNKFFPNDQDIIATGKKHKIHPAILLGRVSYERGQYAIKTSIDRRMN